MRVRVADGGSPSRTATAILTINVLQNLNAPIFPVQDVCANTISEETPAGTLVDTVTATDSDSKVPTDYSVFFSDLNRIFCIFRYKKGLVFLVS